MSDLFLSLARARLSATLFLGIPLFKKKPLLDAASWQSPQTHSFWSPFERYLCPVFVLFQSVDLQNCLQEKGRRSVKNIHFF
jgi:hypothetical protein